MTSPKGSAEISAALGHTVFTFGLAQPGSRHHDGNPEIAIHLLEHLVRCRPIKLWAQLAENSQASIMKLGIGRLEIDHQVVMDLSKSYEQACRDGIQGDLGGRAGLQSC